MKREIMKKKFLIIPILLLSFKSFSSPFTQGAGPLGDLLMAMTPAYAYGMTMMEKDYTGALQLTEQLVASQLTVEIIKKLEIEERPNGQNRHSFPSGHAAGAFSGAMFVHKRYGWKPAILPYTLAVVTGWARVKVKAHYWHDVLAGAAISGLYTWAFVDQYQGFNVFSDGSEVGISYTATF